jgi:hypothetical protein
VSDAKAFFAAAVGFEMHLELAERSATEHREIIAAVIAAVSQGDVRDAVDHVAALPKGSTRDGVIHDVVMGISAGCLWSAELSTSTALQERTRRFISMVRSRDLLERPRVVMA